MNSVLKRNGFSSLLQVIVTGGVYFFLYKYLLESIGVELLGVWSLVLVTVSTASLSELGFASTVIKFVSKYRALGDELKAGEITETAFVTVTLAVLAVSLVAFYPLQLILSVLMPEKELGFALELLPYALASLCINTAAGVMLSSLDGCQRMDIRNILMMIGMLLNLMLILLLLPSQGFIALAYSQFIQAIFLLFTSMLCLKRQLPSIHFIASWKKKHFKEIWRYAAVFQLTSLIVMLYEPLTKGLLSYFGGLSMVGYYEMANRMVMQVRSMIISVNRVFVPAVAELIEVDYLKIKSMYLKSYEFFFSITIIVFTLLAVATPTVSLVWIGESNDVFIYFSWLLIFGWGLNTFTGSAFFFNQGAGCLRPNLYTHVIICLLNIGLGLALGFVYGSFGVVIGWVIALVLGSMPLLIRYHIDNGIPMRSIIPSSGWLILLIVVFGAVITVVTFSAIESNDIPELITGCVVYIIIVFTGVLMTSFGKRIIVQIRRI